MNKPQNTGPIEFLLLDLHLKRLDAQQVEAVEDAIARSPELAQQSQALREVFGLLDRIDTPDAPDNLVDGIMARVNNQASSRADTIPFPKPAAALPTGGSHDLSSSPVLSLRELVAIAACITLFIGVFVPGYYKARSIAARNQCRRHIATLFGGMSSYAAANQGHLPYAGYVPEGSWLFTRQSRVPRASNTRHMFLLLREKQVTDRDFLCPAAPEARRMLADDYSEFSDFADQSNNSYSYIFMNRPRPVKLEDLVRPGAAQMVIVGDRNPLFDARASIYINPFDEASFNSPTHDQGDHGAGQNILYANGQTVWATNPLVGVDKDNIYRSGQRTRYQGNEQPTCATDSFIVP